jgi:hypothetical protein
MSSLSLNCYEYLKEIDLDSNKIKKIGLINAPRLEKLIIKNNRNINAK